MQRQNYQDDLKIGKKKKEEDMTSREQRTQQRDRKKSLEKGNE